jgi:hypothetical protein
MRLHTSTVTYSDILSAAYVAGAVVNECTGHGTRQASQSHAFEVKLAGTSFYRMQSDRDQYAATWDEWGIFLATLYKLDPRMVAGRTYADAHDFHWQTGGRFTTLTHERQHRRHHWGFGDGADSYDARTCTVCGATVRYR